MQTLSSRQVRTSCFLPVFAAMSAYRRTISVASPLLRNSGRTSRPRSITLVPALSCREASVKNSSRNTFSSVEIPFRNPAITPSSSAIRKSSGAAAILSRIDLGEQASFGGKQICSISIVSSVSSGLTVLKITFFPRFFLPVFCSSHTGSRGPLGSGCRPG